DTIAGLDSYFMRADERSVMIEVGRSGLCDGGTTCRKEPHSKHLREVALDRDGVALSGGDCHRQHHSRSLSAGATLIGCRASWRSETRQRWSSLLRSVR